MILRTIGRLILVPIALLLGAGTAAVVAVFLGLQKITVAMAGKEGGAETVAAYWDIAIQGGALIAALTLVPALIVVIVGEVARIRSWLYYMVGGGVSLGLLPLLAQSQMPDLASMPPAALWQVLATAGFAGGLVYWVIAGRTA
ncbi:MAG: hypothetical protein MUC37_01440 [Hyphomicrobium sp.]|jgi:hypothetical protein|nr:hypothetical protein [Hyphomicrobium sp.]